MIYRQTSVYKFLDYCNQSNLEKKVVDCGAGGNMPPLGMFYSEGYETVGIEMDNNQISLAGSFEKKHNIKLNIIKGDMRYIPFKNEVLHSYFEETKVINTLKTWILYIKNQEYFTEYTRVKQ